MSIEKPAESELWESRSTPTLEILQISLELKNAMSRDCIRVPRHTAWHVATLKP
jgi:hypothetical protein